MRLAAFALLALLLAPLALAQAGERIDVRVVVPAQGEPTVTGEGARLLNHTRGEEVRVALNVTGEHATVEARVTGWNVTRARQVLPLLLVERTEVLCADRSSPCDYPLFEPVNDPAVWDVGGPVRVVHVSGAPGDVVLRLGVPGPVNATLVLARDVAPPTFQVGPPQNVTDIGFYQETTTGELALADLQVRPVAGGEWVQNPTPAYHVLQKFPIQGLDADAEYEARVVFTDWSGNNVTSPAYRVRTAPEPVRPLPVVTPVAPLPNATLDSGEGVVVRARFESPESPVNVEGVRLFFDKREVTAEVGIGEGEVAYVVPGDLARGSHSVSVEVTNAAGGRGVARWTFDVGGRNVDAGATAAALVGIAVAAMLAARRK